MNFLKNPVKSISNAAEINKLKDTRTKLNNEKTKLTTLCTQYDDQKSLKEKLEKNQMDNNETLGLLQTLFVKNGIRYEIGIEDFTNSNTDENYIVYKRMYDQMILSNKSIQETITHVDKNTNVKRETYAEKITEIDNKIYELNEKLKNVREKQFSK